MEFCDLIFMDLYQVMNTHYSNVLKSPKHDFDFLMNIYATNVACFPFISLWDV